jgi:hypothetical protein
MPGTADAMRAGALAWVPAGYLARALPSAELVCVSKTIRKLHRWSAGRAVIEALNHAP